MIRCRDSQRGSVLLTMMLVMVVSASFVLVSKLNSSALQFSRQGSSLAVLNEAKAALIGYAVNYPEISNNTNGAPGTLPCPEIYTGALPLPDPWPVGQAGGNCSFPATAIGRFPWSTLEMARMTDYSGEELWYIVADNFRTPPPGPINSETGGNLIMDGSNDVVAVIIAPGNPVGNQVRTSDANKLDVANYLEGANADTTVNYVSRAAGQFNDTVITITRQELMQAVEKRVLGTVSQAISTYQGTYNSYPWPSPFTSADYKGVSNTYQGRLPYHVSTDNTSYTTTINVSWDLSSAALFEWASGTSVTTSCIIATNCGTDDPFGAVNEIPFSAGCVWSTNPATSQTEVDCTLDKTNGFWSEISRFSADNLSRRRYVIRRQPILSYTGDTTVINDAATSNLGVRTRTLTKSNFSLTNNENTDVLYVIDYQRACGTCAWNLLDYAYAFVTTATNIDSMSIEIPYDLDVDIEELPPWFVSNDWEELIYVAYASGEPLPGDTTVGQDCVTLAANCLSVDADSIVTPAVRAVAVSAGADLTGSRTVTTIADYFENDNVDADDVFSKNRITTANNDQSRIIETAP